MNFYCSVFFIDNVADESLSEYLTKSYREKVLIVKLPSRNYNSKTVLDLTGVQVSPIIRLGFAL